MKPTNPRERIAAAAQLRAAHAERAFELASAEYVARHLGTAIKACDHEKRHLRALHADVLETRAAAAELAVTPETTTPPSPRLLDVLADWDDPTTWEPADLDGAEVVTYYVSLLDGRRMAHMRTVGHGDRIIPVDELVIELVPA